MSKNFPKNVPANVLQWKAGLFIKKTKKKNNLILNAYFRRLELVQIVMRAWKGVMPFAQSSSETPQQQVQTCRFRPQPVDDTRCAAQLTFEWSFSFIIHNNIYFLIIVSLTVRENFEMHVA